MYRIYWADVNGVVGSHDAEKIDEALRVTKERRDAGCRFVVMAAEDPNQVGKPGVDAVVNGKTPDGHPYDWSKAGRAGQVRRR